MAHLSLDFPRDVAAGAQAIRSRRTDIVQLASGAEERNQRWSRSRRSFQAGLGIRNADDLDAVVGLWEQAAGPVHSFRFRDWTDWKSGPPSAAVLPTDQELGDGDGSQTAFQIGKTYGTAQPHFRPVYLPALGSVRVALDGVEQGGGWSVSATGGVVTFSTAPGPGVIVSAGFEYDLPVRFDADTLAIDLAYFDAAGAGIAAAPDVMLLEVRI